MAFCIKDIELLLELLKPGRTGEFKSTFRVTDRGEPLGLLLELGIVQRLAFDPLIVCPVRQCPFNIWKFTLCLFR